MDHYKKISNNLIAVIFIFLFSFASSADEETPLDYLVLNEGGNLNLRVNNHKIVPLYINNGSAKRVPRKPHIPFDIGKKVLELDIGTRAFSATTDARQIALSGPREASISGVDTANWGSIDYPAIFLDRDCRIVLLGKADSSAVIRVNPLARAIIDARKLQTPKITIIGNSKTNVFATDGTVISFIEDRVVRRRAISGGWVGESPASAPASPGASPPPGGAPAAPGQTGAQPAGAESSGAGGMPAAPGAAPGGNGGGGMAPGNGAFGAPGAPPSAPPTMPSAPAGGEGSGAPSPGSFAPSSFAPSAAPAFQGGFVSPSAPQ
jgi:hypothetical protein